MCIQNRPNFNFPIQAHYPGPSAERYGAECDPAAGAVPCHLVNFFNIESAEDLFNRVERDLGKALGTRLPQ